MNRYISLLTFFIALLCIIVPWLAVQSQYMVGGNVSWLSISAGRLLSGQSLSEHIYETNPPLSILIYIPHVLFSKAFGFPITTGSFYFTSILVFISSLSVHGILKKFNFLSHGEKTAFILGYLVSITLVATINFSDREHLIILTLIPFILCQYALTNNIKITKYLLIPILIIGASCILVKPHYGLLPSIFLLHRLIKQRRINIFFDIDFIILSVATLTYISIIFLFFNDYTQIILPDVVRLYASNTQPDIAIKSIQLYLIINITFFLWDFFREDLSKEKKSLLLFMHSCAALCFIPYFVQMMGFYNHIIPIYSFFICAITLSISFYITRFFENYKILHIIIPTACVLFIIYAISPTSNKITKQTDIPNLPVTKFLEKECPKPCTYFAFHGDIEIFNPTSAYMGYTHASRFPSLWFIPQILKGLSEGEPDKYKLLKDKYTQMVAKDFIYYKPSVLLIANKLPLGDLKEFDFFDFFGKDILNGQYSKTGQFEFDRAEYFKGTSLGKSYILKYDIYKRN